MPNYLKQWILGTVVVSIASVTFTLWREHSSDVWREWNERRLLLVEMNYRLSNCIERHVAIKSAKNLCEGNFQEAIDNSGPGFRRFIVPSLRDRTFDSLFWDLVQRYERDAKEQRSLELIYNQVNELRKNGGTGDHVATVTDNLGDLLRAVLNSSPGWWWLPNRAEALVH